MTKQNNPQTQSILRLLAAVLLLSLSASAFVPQEEDEGVRRTKDERRFKDARAAKKPSPRPAPPSQPGENKSDVADATDGELLGVTFWRLNPIADEKRSLSSAKGEQDDTRLMIPARKGAPPQPYHAARIGDDATFRNGELVWPGIEVPRADDSFVYVLDREQYADGTLGDPYLIFPAPTTPEDANIASAGRIVYVPAPDDPLPYFRLERSAQRHIAERLTIIVSPRRLTFRGEWEEVDADIKLLRVATAEAARCDREWSGQTERLPARRDLSAGITKAEQDVRETRKMIPTKGEQRRLLPADLLPHTIYRVRGKAGQPVLVSVSLRIAP